MSRLAKGMGKYRQQKVKTKKTGRKRKWLMNATSGTHYIPLHPLYHSGAQVKMAWHNIPTLRQNGGDGGELANKKGNDKDLTQTGLGIFELWCSSECADVRVYSRAWKKQYISIWSATLTWTVWQILFWRSHYLPTLEDLHPSFHKKTRSKAIIKWRPRSVKATKEIQHLKKIRAKCM